MLKFHKDFPHKTTEYRIRATEWKMKEILCHPKTTQ
jgi:hypothetical protein